MRLAIVIPAYNERATIQELLARHNENSGAD